MLGPLLVIDDSGGSLPVGGARLRALLIRLALDAGRTVSTDALIDAIWGDDPPSAAANALQALVSRLRRSLPDGAISAEPTGYRVQATTDIDEFEALAKDERFADALRLWRGDPLQDVADAEFARAAIARLIELKASTTEDAFAKAGPFAVDIAEIESFAAAHPLRERPHAQLIGALAAAGRQADAVAVYEGLRHRLADELGLDPSPELADAYASMLRGERVSGNVRVALTSFVGRDVEIEKIASLVRENRLLTLVGPGGAGKTRLANEAGRRLPAEFSGGVWMVELAPVRSSDDVPRAVADALRLREIRLLDMGVSGDASGDATERVTRALESRELLLILDNCEHLIDAAARFADSVLSACPDVRVITTSREPLAITGETLCPVGPLATPPSGTSTVDAGAVASVRLFTDRATAVKPGFAVNDANVGAVVEICRRLDGMPLAIELACARLRTLPVEAIAARLDDRFRLLTGGSRTAMPRHQTLLAVVEWSWELLADAERRLAASMSVFLNGASNETIADVFGDVDEPLAGLVDKSFVTLDSDGRYQMLETIRAFAGDRLRESGRSDEVRGAVAAYLTSKMEIAERSMRGPEQSYWLAWTGAERDNLIAAMRWAVDSGNASIAVRLAGALGWFWLLSDAHVEATTWLAQALSIPGDVSDEARALALGHYGINLMIVREEPVVEDPLGQARALGSRHPVVSLSTLLASMFGDAIDKVNAELPALLEHEDPWVRSIGLAMDGLTKVYTGEPELAEEKLLKSLDQFRGIGDQWAIATMTAALAEIRAMRGDHEGAQSMLEEATELAAGLGSTDVETQTYTMLGLMRARSGDLAGGYEALDRARAAIRHTGSRSPQTGSVLDCAYAELARRSGKLTQARDLYRVVVSEMASITAMARELYAMALSGLALTEVGLNNAAEAERLAVQILEVARSSNDRMSMLAAASVFAAAAVDQGDADRAAYLVGLGDSMRGIPDQGNPDMRDIVSASRAQIGDAAFDAAYQRAFGMSFDDASAVLEDGARAAMPG